MKPITLALLGSAALAALSVPGAAHAQTAASMTPALDCEEESPSATPTPGSTPVADVDPDDHDDDGGTGTGGGTPTPTPSGPGGGGGGGGSDGPTKYLTSPNIGNMRVTTGKSDHASGGVVHYYRAGPLNSEYLQDLAAVKTYPTPYGSGVMATIGGQKILMKDKNQKITGLSSGITRVVDEINLSAAALGYPDPILTAGHDTDGHSSTSKHYTGNALDLRCNAVNGMTTTQCKKWVVTLSNALGSKYDVIFEDYGNSNSHVHVGYKG
jgi:hypothetical protein